jgi:predicted DsbA family dithiol-disulfide isomerase
VGLDAEEVRTALSSQRFAPAVRDEQAEATALGVRGVPFFVVDRRYGVSGAQPADQLLEVLDRAWERGSIRSRWSGPDGDARRAGPDGCAI